MLQLFIKDTEQFLFGKYKGETLKNVIDFHKSYVNWALKNDIIDIKDESIKQEALRYKPIRQNYSPSYDSIDTSTWSAYDVMDMYCI